FPCTSRWKQLGLFDIGRVIAFGTVNDGRLTGIGDDHKFMSGITPDRSWISLDRTRCKAAAVKDRRIGLIHQSIAFIQSGLIAIKGIAVFHDELSTAHQTETRPYLIPVFILNLVQAQR